VYRQILDRLGQRPTSGDTWPAALICGAVVALAWAPPTGRALTSAEWFCVLVACGALLWRRRFPAATFAVSALAAELFLAQYDSHQAVLLLAAPLLALYTVAHTQQHRRRHLIAAGAVTLVLAGMHIAIKPRSLVGAGTVALVAFGALAVAAGEATRHRRAYLAEVEARAIRAEEERDAEIARRETEAAQRLTEERLRIARDLHDALGHQLAVINLQAAAADHTLVSAPDLARTALGHVRAASKTALVELRDTIGLLRANGDASPIDPTVGLAELDALYRTYQRLGLIISARADLPAALSPAVDVTAYRVIQEGLSNVWRHAGPTDAAVSIVQRDGHLDVRVANRSPVASPPAHRGTGHGLLGLEERLNALGGTLSAAPTSGGGYLLAASIPLG
jgi:signal transduction histidine kinase